ncbi:transmembrane amino acid transporter protein-domain-containing protein [Aspergillus parasiticus]|uniref:Transmembrane amino acid transporter protein-domain-containing protein n=2 Tax=Aspergillus subgen. Circumdati TaxID=2720871 RepID=A0A5N6DP43_ASPPA|nr:transmembrane amino acid transporter protein-domain-containing protein [Aspergillus parasiticus]KAE8315519.1 transmembrane amino acid transporter protein-domain-containing protein [Aspergillus transmontanensis]
MSEKKQDDILPPEPYHVEYLDKDQGVVDQDAVFGEITEEGPNYRNVGWLGTTALMMKTQIGLGVLSIPLAFDTLGLIPGVIVLCAIAVITTWSDYIVGVFKLRHREVYGIDDTGALMFGYPGRVILGAAFCLYWTFVAGSGMLGVSISLNAVSTHGACTAIFVAVAAIVGFMLASIQTLARISWIAWVGLFGILTAIFIVTIAVGLQDRPYAAPQEGVWVSDYKLIASPTFTQAITAISSIVFAYAGTPAFFSIVSEMREPRHYTRSLVICQSVVTATYIAIGCVVYYFCGSYVASPALGSAGPTVKKISYGFALPGLLMTTLLVIHLPAKYLFIRILQGSRHLTANTMTHWVTWLGCTSGIAIIAYIIASAIPVFNDLVSLVGALLGTLMSFQPMGCMWLYDNWSKGKISKSPKWIFMVCWSGFVILSGTFLMIGGTYGSVVSIIDSYKKSGGSAAWSCADNSNSV